jgi:hypothetical protein
MKRKTDTNLVTVGPVRMNWVEVFKPKLNTLKQPPVEEYSVTIMFPKEDNEISIKAAQEVGQFKAVLQEYAHEKFGKVLPKGFKNPLKDGDADGEHESNNGYYYMRVSTSVERPPRVIDGARNPIGSGWKSGDWGFVQMSVYAYDLPVAKGVSAGLSAVQFTRKGDSLGGESVDLDEFDSVTPVEDDAEYDPWAE